MSESYDHPLNEYFIRSSHNSYSLAWADVTPQPGSLAKFLDNGFRAIEIDAYENADEQLMVAHHKISIGDKVTLTQMLDEIHDWQVEHPNHLPIIVNLDMTKRPWLRSVRFLLAKLIGRGRDSIGTKVAREITQLFEEKKIFLRSFVGRGRKGVVTWPTVEEMRGTILFGIHQKFHKKINSDLKNYLIEDDARFWSNYNFKDIKDDPEALLPKIDEDHRLNKLIRVYPEFDPIKMPFERTIKSDFNALIDLGIQIIGMDGLEDGEHFFGDKSYIHNSKYEPGEMS